MADDDDVVLEVVIVDNGDESGDDRPERDRDSTTRGEELLERAAGLRRRLAEITGGPVPEQSQGAADFLARPRVPAVAGAASDPQSAIAQGITEGVVQAGVSAGLVGRGVGPALASIGPAAIAVVGALGTLAVSAVAVRKAFREIESQADSARPYNAAVAGAFAQADVQSIQGDIRRAELNQETLARFVSARAGVDQAILDLKAQVISVVGPSLTTGLLLLEKLLEATADFASSFEGAGTVMREALLAALKMYLPVAIVDKLEAVIDKSLDALDSEDIDADVMEAVNELLDPRRVRNNV